MTSTTTKPVTAQPFQPSDDFFEAACDLARDSAVTSVQVAARRPLTGEDLLRYRRRASARNLSLVAIKARGSLGFRLFRRAPRNQGS